MNLEAIGARLLPWLDDEVLPIAAQLIESTHQYVRAWRALLLRPEIDAFSPSSIDLDAVLEAL